MTLPGPELAQPIRETKDEIAALFDKLWPLFRSITGDGVRQSLDVLSAQLPLTQIEVPTGTPVFDWIVPKEWVVREAHLTGPDGRRIADIRDNNLHLVNYAVPFRGRIDRAELDRHLHSRPDQPDAIPYVTSYYSPAWGFCLPHRVRAALPDGDYDVVIDTDHVDGSLTLGEAVLPGESDEEVLFSTYVCHPSMANNELSGPLVAAFLYRRLSQIKNRRLTYRFVFLPETIGSLAYLSLRGDHLKRRLLAGYILTCIGDSGPFTYKRSRHAASLANRAAEYALKRRGAADSRVLDFSPIGSDERQYCSLGFDLPVGSLMRTPYGQFPEYHTSLDNRSFIDFDAIGASVDMALGICRILEDAETFVTLVREGEPNLGRRGLYPAQGGNRKAGEGVTAILWALHFSDGQTDLLSIAERSGVPLEDLADMARRCAAAGIMARGAPKGHGT